MHIPAPFNDQQGNPFLESHHIDWPSNGGKSPIQNIVSLCRYCHRKMHVLNLEKYVNKLKSIASNYPLD